MKRDIVGGSVMLKKATKEDAVTLARLAIQMWEDNEIEELAEHFESLRFHMAMEFEEANRVICFKKSI